MSKVYLYKGKKYSNDWFCDNNNNYDGSLWELFEALAENNEAKVEQHTYVYFTVDGEQVADDNWGIYETTVDDLINDGYAEGIVTEIK